MYENDYGNYRGNNYGNDCCENDLCFWMKLFDWKRRIIFKNVGFLDIDDELLMMIIMWTLWMNECYECYD